MESSIILRERISKPAVRPSSPLEIWAWSLIGILVVLSVAAFIIPIHGTPAIVGVLRERPENRLEFQAKAFRERNLREYVQAVYRDYDKLTSGPDESSYHEALAAEYHAERSLAMLDRTLAELEKPGCERFATCVQKLAPMKTWYEQLVRQLKLNRALRAPLSPQEPLELFPTPPAVVPRPDG